MAKSSDGNRAERQGKNVFKEHWAEWVNEEGLVDEVEESWLVDPLTFYP